MLCKNICRLEVLKLKSCKATCLAWSAMIETPTFDMPIIQPMLTAVSLTLNKVFSVALEVADAPGPAGAHDSLQALENGCHECAADQSSFPLCVWGLVLGLHLHRLHD